MWEDIFIFRLNICHIAWQFSYKLIPHLTSNPLRLAKRLDFEAMGILAVQPRPNLNVSNHAVILPRVHYEHRCLFLSGINSFSILGVHR
jgi:hypothetical protein